MRQLLLAVLVVSGCTTLGPMPATTGISAIPSGRPGLEVQAGAVPGYYLSSAVSGGREGSGIPQTSVLLEPGRFIGVRGLVVGGRRFGQGGDALLEPMVGYRRALDDGFAFAVLGYGTSQRAAQSGADYHAFRAGAEVAADGRVAAFTRWLSLHAQGAVSLTRLVASGGYCVNAAGEGVDCSDTPADDPRVGTRIRGLYPSATAQLSLDAGRTPRGIFHSARFALMLTAGSMPTVNGGLQGDSHPYFGFGASLTLGLGAPD